MDKGRLIEEPTQHRTRGRGNSSGRPSRARGAHQDGLSLGRYKTCPYLLLLLLLSVMLAGCNTAAAEQSPVAQGKELFTKFGLITCHQVSTTEVEKKVGPPLVG